MSTGASRYYASDEDRVVRNVEVAEDGCWNWTGTIYKGYGQISVGSRAEQKTWRAHRFTYEVLVERIPDGLVIDHLCRNTRCVNPDHLEPVMQAENLRRQPVNAASINAAKTHCKRGHEYNAENTRRGARGGRYCLACKRYQWHQSRARKAAA